MLAEGRVCTKAFFVPEGIPSCVPPLSMRRKQPGTFIEDRTPEREDLLQKKVSDLGLRLEGMTTRKGNTPRCSQGFQAQVRALEFN